MGRIIIGTFSFFSPSIPSNKIVLLLVNITESVFISGTSDDILAVEKVNMSDVADDRFL